MPIQLTREQFDELVRQALQSLPEQFQPYLQDLTVEVQPAPDPATLRKLGMTNSRSLLGLYRGLPLTRRSVEHSGRLPEVVVIYQHNIERICHTAQQVIQQVRRTVLHEVGHHFGLDERQLRQLGY